MIVKIKFLLSVFLGAILLFPFSARAQVQSTTPISFCYSQSGSKLSWKDGDVCPAGTNAISSSGIDSDFKAVCVVQDLKKDTFRVAEANVDVTGKSYDCKKYDVDGVSAGLLVNRSSISGTDPATVNNQNSTTKNTSNTTKQSNTTKSSNTTTSTSGGSCPSGFTSKGPLCIPDNPFGSEDGIAGKGSIGELATTIIGILLFLAGIVAVIMLIYGGYVWMTARGNENQATDGRKTLINAIIGLIIIIMAYGIIQIVTNLITKGTT